MRIIAQSDKVAIDTYPKLMSIRSSQDGTLSIKSPGQYFCGSIYRFSYSKS
jgi:hypothetical protein